MGSSSFRFLNSLNPHTWIMGKKASSKMDLGGQLVGAYDDVYHKPEDVQAPPDPTVDDGAYAARDNQRRRAMKAQGLQSTIRTSATGAPYTGAPAKLLGG